MGRWTLGLRALIAAFVLIMHLAGASAADDTVHIGVIAFRGPAAAHKTWDAHADYLTKALPGYRFEIVPLTLEGIRDAVKRQEVQFVITNTGQYAELEHTGQLTRIATRRMATPMGPLDRFGGVVITRVEREDLNTYADLAGKIVLTPDAKGFGGWQMHVREALLEGIDLRKDLARVIETRNQEEVVHAVLAGKGDAGFIRSDLLEGMAQEGKIRLSDVKVVNPRAEQAFPYLLSTRLYPEWPLARVNGTPESLAKQVLIALYGLTPDSPPLRAARMDSWTIPLNYEAVNELFRETRMGPYANLPLTPREWLKEHWRPAFGLALLLFMLLVAGLVRGHLLNRRLQEAIQKRIEVENSLEESERRFRATADALPSLIWIAGTDMQINFFNQGWLSFTGRRMEDELGTGWKAGIHPDDLEYCLTTYANAFRNGQAFQLEHRLRGADGEYHWVSNYGAPRYARDGAFLGYVGYCADITAQKRIQESLASQEQEFRSLVSNIPGIVNRRNLTPDQSVLYVSEHLQVLTGYAPATFLNQPDRSFAQLIHADDRERVWQQMQAQADSATGFTLEYRIIDTAGTVHHVRERCKAHRDAAGVPQWLDGVIFDISNLKAAEEELRQAAIVFENTAEGILVSDAEARIMTVNPAFTELTGYTLDEIRGDNPRILASGRHDQTFYQQLWSTLHGKGRWQGEIWNRRKNGEIFPVWQTISALRDESGITTGYVSVFSDISHVKQAEAELQQLAYHDALTGLPNRMLFNERLVHALQQSVRHGDRLAVLYFDLDRFKALNDSLGHQAGDELLEAISARLSLRLRKSDTLSRRGGDEFTVLLENLSEPEQAANVARDILHQLSLPFSLPSANQVKTGTSIGISLYPEDGQNAEQLIKCADMAMYEAKQAGGSQYRFYSQALTSFSKRRMDLGDRLGEALTKDLLQLLYQPLYDVTTGRLVGTEALIRWDDEIWGKVDPEEIVAIAEEFGLMDNLADWSLHTACRQAQGWHASGLANLHVSVNISPRQLRQKTFSNRVQSALEATGLPPNRLELEVGEAGLLALGSAELDALRELQGLGITITVDDFGLGYSALSRLHGLPVNRLKIDRSFVRDIPEKDEDMETVSVIVAMAKTLRLEVTAEGVETEDQMRFIQAQHCDAAQGFLLSHPVTPDKIPQLAESVAMLDTYRY